MGSGSTKNQLVVAGCSMIADYVTYKNKLSNNGTIPQPASNDAKLFDWIVLEPWPTIDVRIAKAFDNVPVNIAIPGASNERIFKESCKHIMANADKVDRLVVCWSLFNRYDLELKAGEYISGHNSTSLHPSSYDPNAGHKNMHDEIRKLWYLKWKLGAIDPYLDINNFFFWNRILRDLCYMHDIKLYQCSSIKTNYENDKSIKAINIFKYINEHPDYDEVEQNYFGWPIHPLIGGKCLFDTFTEEFVVHPEDKHPSEHATQTAADKMIDFIKGIENA